MEVKLFLKKYCFYWKSSLHFWRKYTISDWRNNVHWEDLSYEERSVTDISLGKEEQSCPSGTERNFQQDVVRSKWMRCFSLWILSPLFLRYFLSIPNSTFLHSCSVNDTQNKLCPTLTGVASNLVLLTGSGHGVLLSKFSGWKQTRFPLHSYGWFAVSNENWHLDLSQHTNKEAWKLKRT